jgi:hypothetical protein
MHRMSEDTSTTTPGRPKSPWLVALAVWNFAGFAAWLVVPFVWADAIFWLLGQVWGRGAT